MHIIKQNPFRILGLKSNTKERELQNQISIIKRYAEVGKTKSFDFDFGFIGDFTRNPDEIQEASNSIEQAYKKLIYSLFWFVKTNQFDEIAFNNLKEKEIDKAIDIWNKTLKQEITSKNYSSYHNLSTLYLALSIIDDQIDLQKLQDGISLEGSLIHSECLKDYTKLITGNDNISDPIEISKKFVDEIVELLKPYLNKRKGVSTKDLISFFDTFPTTIKKYISAKFTETPISSIESKVEKTARKRKDNWGDPREHGEELYKSTKSDITLLKKLLGSSNIQFQMLADKVANEVLQCSIDFFNERQKNDSDDNFESNLDKAISLVKIAGSVAITSQVKQRVKENTDILNSMRDRALNQSIELLESIITADYKAHNNHRTLDWDKVVELIRNNISTENVRTIKGSLNHSKVKKYQNKVDLLFGLLRQRQINQLAYLCYWKDVQIKSTAYQAGAAVSKASGGNCYIATMAYGDYDHPQVMILRKFRDDTLSNTFFGRSFIQILDGGRYRT